MTDLGTRVPLIVRWPGQVKAGSHCSDLIDFTDLFPTLCEIAGAKFPLVPIHGRSFLPQLTDHSGEPREWVHLQNYNNRYLRSRYYFYDPEGDLRPVVELGREEPFPDRPPESEARDRLKADYDSLSE